MPASVQELNAADQISRLQFSVTSAVILYQFKIPRQYHPEFLKRGRGEFMMWARKFLGPHAFKFEDYDRMWRILQYLMTSPQPNMTMAFLEKL